MRACLAILIDSFREAAASRILWIALATIVVVLLALSPLGFKTATSTQLRPFELVDTERFLRTLAEGKAAPDTAAGHLWSLLSDDQKKNVNEWINPEAPVAAQPADRHGPPRPGRLQSKVLDVINQQLKKPEFYKAEAWASVKMDDSLKAADAASLPVEELAAKNLKRLARAFPQSMDVQGDLSVSLSYGTMVLFGPLEGAPSQTERLIDETTIVILSVFLGFFGVFSSLLITASIIPRTFEPGEISLLLSKPIRRSVLFVTKFFGGCAFTLLCATVLVTGIWLLLWARFGLWRPELLLCIPLYVFLFAVYFSVSALAGVIWKNPTVSLILVVLFWIVVTTTGAVYGFMTDGYFQTQRIVEVTAAGDEVFVVDGARKIRRWDSEAADWKTACDDGRGNSLLRLLQQLQFKGIRPRIVMNEDGSKLVAVQSETSRFGDAAPGTLFTGAEDNDYIREIETTTPEPVFGVFVNKDGQMILPGTRSVYRFIGVSDQVKKTQAFFKRMPFGLFNAPPSQAFEILAARETRPLRGDAAVAFNLSNDSLVYWDHGTLSVQNREADGKYTAGATRTFDPPQSAIVASGGEFVLYAAADGTVRALDRTTLDTIAEMNLPTGEKPRFAEFATDGSWGVVLTHSGKIVTFGGREKSFVDWTPQENGRVSAIRFDVSGRLMVADGRRTISFYEYGASAPVRSLKGQTAWPYDVYDYAVLPLYRLLPKPSEVNNMVRYLVTGENSEVVGENSSSSANAMSEDLSQQRVTFDVRKSFLSNLAFIVVMLTVGCVYLMRQDF
jgi:hypothetical protein